MANKNAILHLTKNIIMYFNEFYCMQDEGVAHVMPIFTEVKSETDDEKQRSFDSSDLPILALRNMVLFPGITMPVAVGRSKSLALVKEAQKTNSLIGVVCQTD